MHLRFNQKYQKWWFGNLKGFGHFLEGINIICWIEWIFLSLLYLNSTMQIDILTQLLAWSSAMKYIDEIGQYFFFLSLYFLCLTQCKKCFLKKKKVLEKSVRPTTTSDQCWLEEYSLKSGVPPSIAFIKARSVYQGHITVQDTSFAKIGLHIPVHCKSRNL